MKIYKVLVDASPAPAAKAAAPAPAPKPVPPPAADPGDEFNDIPM